MIKKVIKYILIILPIVAIVWFLFLRPKQLTSLVRKVQVANHVVTRSVSASGEVKSLNQADLTFISAGKIRRILVKEGETVTAGKLLAYLDTFTQNQTAQSYKDARDIALRNKELYEKDREANIELLGGEDAYNIKIRSMNEQISQAEAAYQAQLGVLSNGYIYAPFAGIITEIAKDEGETSVTGEKVMQIADLKDYQFEISIDQEDFGYIKIGQPVKVILDSYPDFDFTSQLTELPLVADAATGVFNVKFPLTTDESHRVAIGMLGDAYIDVLTTGSEVKTLTIDEIFYDTSDNPYVWVVENGKLKKLPVELGSEGDLYTEIKTDVTEVVVPADENQKMEEGYFARVIN